MIVRLKVSLSANNHLTSLMFQFYDSPIKSTGQNLPHPLIDTCFNSMIVRLKEGGRRAHTLF